MLASQLNARRDADYEVLNFGISNYGVGQYLLAWERYASRFAPAYVIAFTSDFVWKRTLRSEEFGGFAATAEHSLRVRPTFRVEAGVLIREPAADYRRFIATQRELRQREFDGERSRVRVRSVTAYFARKWLTTRAPFNPAAMIGDASPSANQRRLVINRAVIVELKRQVERSGAELAIVDATRHLTPWAEELADQIENDRAP